MKSDDRLRAVFETAPRQEENPLPKGPHRQPLAGWSSNTAVESVRYVFVSRHVATVHVEAIDKVAVRQEAVRTASLNRPELAQKSG